MELQPVWCCSRLTGCGGHLLSDRLQKWNSCSCTSTHDFLGVSFKSDEHFTRYFANRQVIRVTFSPQSMCLGWLPATTTLHLTVISVKLAELCFVFNVRAAGAVARWLVLWCHNLEAAGLRHTHTWANSSPDVSFSGQHQLILFRVQFKPDLVLWSSGLSCSLTGSSDNSPQTRQGTLHGSEVLFLDCEVVISFIWLGSSPRSQKQTLVVVIYFLFTWSQWH